MPDLRYDPLTGDMIFIAEGRERRPMTIFNKKLPCPFCPENTHLAAEEHFRSEDGRVRVIKNLYPFVDIDGGSAYGYHDVVIDTNIHGENFEDFTERDIYTTLSCIARRVSEMENDPRIKYVQVFKNRGVTGGASVEHSHWQIAALPGVPGYQQKITAKAGLTKSCAVCGMMNRNIVWENPLFTVFCPPAPRFSYEMFIAPKRHCPSFSGFCEEELLAFASALKAGITALRGVLPDTDYNICFQTSSVNAAGIPGNLHFFAEIVPRIGYIAGFEIATNCHSCFISPESAAEKLRQNY